MRLQLQNPLWVIVRCSLTSFRFRKYIVLFCGDDMLMTHVGYTGFTACIHAIMLPFPDLVTYHFVRVCEYHIVCFTLFFYYQFGDLTHHFTFICLLPLSLTIYVPYDRYYTK